MEKCIKPNAFGNALGVSRNFATKEPTSIKITEKDLQVPFPKITAEEIAKIGLQTNFEQDVDVWSNQAMGRGENPNAPSYSFDIHAVRRGDSLAKLAREKYGDERYALALAQANNISGTLLKEGQEVILPDFSDVNLKQGGAFIAADAARREADAVRNLYAYVNGTQAERAHNPYYVMARNARDMPNYGFPLTNQYKSE